MKDTAKPTAALLETRVHKMLAHPLRHEIVMKTGERPWCPTEVAEATGEDIRRVTEQFEILTREALIELVERRPGPKGGMSHFYRAVTRFMLGPDEWDGLSDLVQARSTETILRVLHGDMRRSLDSGDFHTDPTHVLIRNPMWLDRVGRKQVHDILVDAYERIVDVEKESTERRQDSNEPARRVVAGLSAFLAAPDASPS